MTEEKKKASNYSDDLWAPVDKLLDEEKWDTAIEVISETMHMLPDDEEVVAYQKRGLAYGQAGQHGRAIVDFIKAIDLNPADPLSYRGRGDVYHDRGKYDLAIADFDKAIELAPGDAVAFHNRGFAYNEKGEYDRAIADYSRAIALAPEYAAAYNNRGSTHNEKGAYDHAIADLNKAIELAPDDAAAHNNRGFAYDRKGEHDRAIADYNKAIELEPEYAEAYNNRGYAYSEKGEYNRAIEDWEKAIKLAPQQNRQQSEVMVDNLLVMIKTATQQLNKEVTTQLESVEGYAKREKEHDAAQKTAAAAAARGRFFLFAFYILAFTVLFVLKREAATLSEILPWFTAIFVSSWPIIWSVRFYNREKAQQLALRENAYTNQLLTLLSFHTPRDEYKARLAVKFFDRLDMRGSEHLVFGAGKEQSGDTDAKRIFNLLRQDGDK